MQRERVIDIMRALRKCYITVDDMKTTDISTAILAVKKSFKGDSEVAALAREHTHALRTIYKKTASANSLSHVYDISICELQEVICQLPLGRKKVLYAIHSARCLWSVRDNSEAGV